MPSNVLMAGNLCEGQYYNEVYKTMHAERFSTITLCFEMNATQMTILHPNQSVILT